MSKGGKRPFPDSFWFRSRADQLSRHFFSLPERGKDQGSLEPAADVLEREDALVIEVELPGVHLEEVNLHLERGRLCLEGVKSPPGGAPRAKYLLLERQFGSFIKILDLPAPVDASRAEAVLERGLLRIRLPKVPDKRKPRVPIKVRGGPGAGEEKEND